MSRSVLSFISLCFLSTAITSCNSSPQKPGEEDSASTAVRDTSTAFTQTAFGHFDPDTTDKIPAGNYLPNTCNMETVEKVRAALRDTLLNEDLVIMDVAQRKFMLFDLDMNNDGMPEIFVGFDNSYFCGSGGCTIYLLNNDATVNTIFTVSDYPVIVLNSVTKGWKDIVISSGGVQHFLAYEGKQYPANPSMAPVYDKTLPVGVVYVLDYQTTGHPRFAF